MALKERSSNHCNAAFIAAETYQKNVFTIKYCSFYNQRSKQEKNYIMAVFFKKESNWIFLGFGQPKLDFWSYQYNYIENIKNMQKKVYNIWIINLRKNFKKCSFKKNVFKNKLIETLNWAATIWKAVTQKLFEISI